MSLWLCRVKECCPWVFPVIILALLINPYLSIGYACLIDIFEQVCEGFGTLHVWRPFAVLFPTDHLIHVSLLQDR